MDTTLSDALVDRLLDGRYAVAARIARGGMASVYLATDVRLERRVAVKVMHPALADDPEFVARFNREARAAAKLSHPNVVSVYDQGSDGGHVFLVMEYVEGATLREILREQGRLSPAEAVAVMDNVCAALSAAHAAGLVHRDIKPENVLVTTDGRVKVADFGLARAVAGHSLTTDDSMLLGTAAYVAPEQIRDGVSDSRADVYSAGVLMFELLTGTTPFSGGSAHSVAYRHLNEDVPAPSSRAGGVPAELDALVQRATARSPEARYADGGQLHRALLAVRDALDLHAAVPSPAVDLTKPIPRLGAPATDDAGRTTALPPLPPPVSERHRRRRWPYLVLVLVLLATGAGVGGWWLAVGRYFHAPKLVGMTRSEAVATAQHDGLTLHWRAPIYSDVARGHVARETPTGGSRVIHGATLTLALSKGPAQAGVPDVAGDTVSTATAALHAVNLDVGPVHRAYSATVKPGHVIETAPPRGRVLPAGSPVTLVVSKGVKPVPVPNVVNQPLDQARATLKSAGLKVTVVHAYSDHVPKGVVVSTSPTAGTPIKPGATVTVAVSKGPQLFPVPNVTGDTVGDAERILRQAGFQPNVAGQFPGGDGKVIEQRPAANSMEPHGTTIQLYVF